MIWSMSSEQPMSAEHPIDFTMSSDRETVLDLTNRRRKPENDHYRQQRLMQNHNFPMASSSTCYPTSTYFPPNLLSSHANLRLQHARDHSEDSLERFERGSLSPPSVSSPTTTQTPKFFVTSKIMAGTISKNGKPTRPFKAYQKTTMLNELDESFAKFRDSMLSRVQSVNSSTNSKMKRSVSPLEQNQQPTSCTDQDGKDAAYWERRRKNNEAAKRSRDARRAKEDEIAIRAAFLEQENLQLKYENAVLRNEASRLREVICNRC